MEWKSKEIQKKNCTAFELEKILMKIETLYATSKFSEL